MRSYQQLLFVAAGASAAVVGEKRDLEECSSVAVNILPSLADIPTVGSDLVNFVAEQTQFATYTDDCMIPAVTGDSSLAAEYTSWMSELSSWQMEHTSEFSALLSACSDVPEVQSELSSLGPMPTTACSEITWETAAASSDDSSDADADASSDDDNDSAASRTVGAALGAAAVAVGMVAVLL